VLALTESLLAHGFAVAASNAHGPQNWGDPPSVSDYVRLDRQLGYKHVLILAQSMGGLDGLQLVDRLRPEAWAGIYPVCNAQSSYDSTELNPFVEEAWPGPPPKYLSPVIPRDLKGLPVLIWASPEDKVVSFKENSERCSRIMRERGADIRLIRTEGDHGDPSNFHPARLTSFFESASGVGR
jgi:pimeloyl-ACP methyl ester carboxylesterase